MNWLERRSQAGGGSDNNPENCQFRAGAATIRRSSCDSQRSLGREGDGRSISLRNLRRCDSSGQSAGGSIQQRSRPTDSVAGSLVQTARYSGRRRPTQARGPRHRQFCRKSREAYKVSHTDDVCRRDDPHRGSRRSTVCLMHRRVGQMRPSSDQEVRASRMCDVFLRPDSQPQRAVACRRSVRVAKSRRKKALDHSLPLTSESMPYRDSRPENQNLQSFRRMAIAAF